MDTSAIKEEEERVGIHDEYDKVCLDLNLDVETKREAWRCYEHIRGHYVLEGDPLHWLAVSIYLSCRTSSSTSQSNNPISICRLLQSAHQLSLISFFDKLHKWEDMANLPDSSRKQINQIEHSFQISSIIFAKYSQIFEEIFGIHLSATSSSSYEEQRRLIQLHPKINFKQKDKRCSFPQLYSFIWTIYALAKTIYPSTFNDLIASFHLLLASFEYLFQILRQSPQEFLPNELIRTDRESLIEYLCEKYSCSSELTRTISEEYFGDDLLKKRDVELVQWIDSINKKYDEIVLTQCMIDERLFLQHSNQFQDYLHSLNENRHSKLEQTKTPLTVHQHFLSPHHSSSSVHLTPISQANQLIQLLHNLLREQTNKPSRTLSQLIGQEHFLNDLQERLLEWEEMFVQSYHSNELFAKENLSRMDSSRSRFQLSLRLFYQTLENLLILEKKRSLNQQLSHELIQQSFHKLLLNNEFVKSLLGLCLLLVLYSYSDLCHDFVWIFQLYSLQGYSFLKIIQIFYKTSKEICKCRPMIKYLSSIEEVILLSLAFENQSALWKDIEKKGLLKYEQIEDVQAKSSLSTPTDLSHLYTQSPCQVKRQLFVSTTNTCPAKITSLPIIRSQSDPLADKVDRPSTKVSPYTMFYRQLYQLLIRRIGLLIGRLFPLNQSNEFEKTLWTFFLKLFYEQTQDLFGNRHLDQILLSSIFYLSHSSSYSSQYRLTWSRLIQAYKVIPNSQLKTLRSVFLYKVTADQNLPSPPSSLGHNPCLTPSKPAGTTQIFNGNVYGDISSFYTEVFLRLVQVDEQLSPSSSQSFPSFTAMRNASDQHHISIPCGKQLFIQYSSRANLPSAISENNSSSTAHPTDPSSSSSTNVLSSSIQAGAHNTVRTTRIRTEDGKFLTTISTIQKLSEGEEHNRLTRHSRELLFGQTSMNSLKRTFSDGNSLGSLSKKVLQIETDRQNLQQ